MTLGPLSFLEALLGKVTIDGRVITFTLVAAFVVLRRERAQRVLRSKWQPSYADPIGEDAPIIAGPMIDMLDR